MKKQKKSSKIGKACSVALKDDSLSNNNIMNSKLQSGITLIALVISIIVMLILAGVSINAIVGDNGILSRTQYATFINEMTAVEEAVQMWKAGEIIDAKGETTRAIPANGMCNVNDITNTERLAGEIGYYRIWSTEDIAPEISVFADASYFNSKFESELIYYPAGVQDLYYLNNEVIGIKGDKKYLIDAATGMIYSMAGIGLKGVSCYSINMAKAVMSGNLETPIFAEAEVSGTGTGTANAGNTGPEYIEDENGNLIKNPDYNPNGFELFSSFNNNNIYKLYNNGSLYGKGIKGIALNTSPEEMENINANKWNEFTIPAEIPGYDDFSKIKIYPTLNAYLIVDENKDLWAWGANNSNRFGLPLKEQVSYTGYEAIKINLGGRKVSKVWPGNNNIWVLTSLENGKYELYACGNNLYGQLGVGSVESSLVEFKKVDFDNPERIVNITKDYGNTNTLILTNDKKIYFAGRASWQIFKSDTKIYNTDVTKFTQILNSTYGYTDLNIIGIYKYFEGNNFLFLVESNSKQYLYTFNGSVISELKINEAETEILDFKVSLQVLVIKTKIDGIVDYYTMCSSGTNLIGVQEYAQMKWYRISEFFPSGLTFDNIKEVVNTAYNANAGNIFYITNDGKLYASGFNTSMGINNGVGVANGIICISELQDKIKKFDSIMELDDNHISPDNAILFYSNGKLYGTGNSNILFRDKILQKNWTQVASNVKKVCVNSTNCLMLIDRNDDLWVAGSDSYILGTETKEPYEISNLVRLKDIEGLSQESKNILDENIKDCKIAVGATYILTKDNKLYVAGNTTTVSWNKLNKIGIASQNPDGTQNDGTSKYTQILDNVVYLEASNMSKFAVRKVNENYELYAWGFDDSGNMGEYGYEIPTLVAKKLPFEVKSIKKIYTMQRITYVLTNDGKLYVTGINSTNGYGVNGIGNNVRNLFTEFDLSVFNNEKVKDIVTDSSGNGQMVITESNNLYGWGQLRRLGLGTESYDYQMTPKKMDISEIFKNDEASVSISSISSGNGYFVLVKSNGEVWATGSNQNGVLGRWIGIDRKSPNSRYKTAFEWVECPELEI